MLSVHSYVFLSHSVRHLWRGEMAGVTKRESPNQVVPIYPPLRLLRHSSECRISIVLSSTEDSYWPFNTTRVDTFSPCHDANTVPQMPWCKNCSTDAMMQELLHRCHDARTVPHMPYGWEAYAVFLLVELWLTEIELLLLGIWWFENLLCKLSLGWHQLTLLSTLSKSRASGLNFSSWRTGKESDTTKQLSK